MRMGTVVNVPHQIIYQSGTFQDSQKNWTVVTKEAYVIYIFLQYGISHQGCPC